MVWDFQGAGIPMCNRPLFLCFVPLRVQEAGLNVGWVLPTDASGVVCGLAN
eukprot:NODE_3988_length_336_cov_144.324042_g3906_i0.p2 GENE.NODE_3988_length_336_cov_144.324042_g3906_i0~~NODE_3988_length_336_cov_144.324042_g3906_i0.p2  ORF type:complete len:51 (+),score=5.85 NODE_3988_length_336_cov_144.324042_g3906_i0:73-225(+)